MRDYELNLDNTTYMGVSLGASTDKNLDESQTSIKSNLDFTEEVVEA